MEKEIEYLKEKLQQANNKWQYQEREYILPLFEIARKDGWDLEQLVKDNPGKNCVILFVEKIMKQRDDMRDSI